MKDKKAMVMGTIHVKDGKRWITAQASKLAGEMPLSAEPPKAEAPAAPAAPVK